MTHDEGAGVGMFEFDEEGTHRGFLLGCSGIGCFAVGIKATFVADADAVLIVVKTMGSYHGHGTALFDGSISTDDVMVADALPSTLLVPLVNLRCAGGLIVTDSGTMDDD